jgi:hypothetical protein
LTERLGLVCTKTKRIGNFTFLWNGNLTIMKEEVSRYEKRNGL